MSGNLFFSPFESELDKKEKEKEKKKQGQEWQCFGSKNKPQKALSD